VAHVFQCNVFQNNVFQGVCGVVERRGGAFYPTQEELRAALRERKKHEDKERKLEAKIEATLAEAYDETISPGLKAAKLAAVEQMRAEMREIEEITEILTLYLDYSDTFH
jgi:flagellar biosynthesis/type III secretory pathway protein FliH